MTIILDTAQVDGKTYNLVAVQSTANCDACVARHQDSLCCALPQTCIDIDSQPGQELVWQEASDGQDV